MDTLRWYQGFAEFEAHGSSTTYERLARAVASAPAVLVRLDRLPPQKRQPNLLFAAARHNGVAVEDSAAFVQELVDRWDEVCGTMLERSTQTNEPARCGAFLPLLSLLEGPIALIEVGCSAGLCLYPDRYAISYRGEPPLVDSDVNIAVRTYGNVPVPTRVPEVVTRIGIDLNPLRVDEPNDLAWLTTLVWPEHDERRARVRAASRLVEDAPPTLIAGDATAQLGEALALVPDGVTPVVFHSAVLNYLDAPARQAFVERVTGEPRVVWLANEGPTVLADARTDLGVPSSEPSNGFFILSRDGRAVAVGDPHGAWIRWPE
ncbi:MAG: DUF2332 domain-containing protein [Actinomycetota bacterium]